MTASAMLPTPIPQWRQLSTTAAVAKPPWQPRSLSNKEKREKDRAYYRQAYFDQAPLVRRVKFGVRIRKKKAGEAQYQEGQDGDRDYMVTPALRVLRDAPVAEEILNQKGETVIWTSPEPTRASLIGPQAEADSTQGPSLVHETGLGKQEREQTLAQDAPRERDEDTASADAYVSEEESWQPAPALEPTWQELEQEIASASENLMMDEDQEPIPLSEDASGDRPGLLVEETDPERAAPAQEGTYQERESDPTPVSLRDQEPMPGSEDTTEGRDQEPAPVSLQCMQKLVEKDEQVHEHAEQSEADLQTMETKLPENANSLAKRLHPSFLHDIQDAPIYILGADIRGRFIAHCMAAHEPLLPRVRYLLHRQALWDAWVEEGERFELYSGEGIEQTEHVTAEFLVADEAAPRGATVSGDDPIYNLIVTVPAHSVVRSLRPLMHRITPRTTICLIQDGLGIVEVVMEALFGNVSWKPTFVLGHMTHRLLHDRESKKFSVAEVQSGRLFLTAYGSGGRTEKEAITSAIRVHPPIERQVQAVNMLRTLISVPGLGASGTTWVDWLAWKLPSVVFQAIADPVITLVDARDSHTHTIPHNPYARQIMDHLLGELMNVVAHMPEARLQTNFTQYVRSAQLREAVFKALKFRRNSVSTMRQQTLRGWASDIDFLLGYFIHRGRELGIKTNSLKTILWMVKAKQEQIYRAKRAEVRLVWGDENLTPVEDDEEDDHKGQNQAVMEEDPFETMMKQRR